MRGLVGLIRGAPAHLGTQSHKWGRQQPDNTMPIYIDVDTAVALPVNIMPLLDDGDFKTRETSVAYNAAGMDLVWNFVTSAGAMTQTAVTPTTSGDYDWSHVGDGMYKIEIPASGGASINNSAEGSGWFSGIATGVLPWISPTYCFRSAATNDALCDGGDVLPVNVIQWLDTDCAAPTVAGVPEVDITHINGEATSGNNATLNLKQLNVVNSAGSAIVATSSGSNGVGISATGNGAGQGILITAGSTASGLGITGGTNASAIYCYAGGTQPTVRFVNAGSSHAFTCESTSTGDAVHFTATSGSAFLLTGTGSGNFCIECSPASSATDSNLEVQATDGSGAALATAASVAAISTVDGITLASAVEALLAVTTGVATVSGSTVTFKKRDGTTTKMTITYGSNDGERTSNTLS